MNNMFDGCSSLKKLNIYNFDFQKVIKENYMFFGCSSLEELTIKNFNENSFSSSTIFRCCPPNLKITNQ